MSKKTTILGAGNWGTVLAILAAKRMQNVALFDHNPERALEIQKTRVNLKYLPGIQLPENILVTAKVDEALEGATLVMPVVPAPKLRALLSECKSALKPSQYIVHAIKGFEPQTHKRMSEIIADETGCLRTGALSGPNLAHELAHGLPGATVVASRFEEVIACAKDCFEQPGFKVHASKDIIGVEWIGALKNILALLAGAVTEFKLGQNAFAMFLTQGLDEIRKILKAVGASEDTILTLAGFGDVLATSTSAQSRNFRAGQLLAQGLSVKEVQTKLEMTAEGLNTIEVAYEVSQEHQLRLPLLDLLYQLKSARLSTADFLKKLSA